MPNNKQRFWQEKVKNEQMTKNNLFFILILWIFFFIPIKIKTKQLNYQFSNKYLSLRHQLSFLSFSGQYGDVKISFF